MRPHESQVILACAVSLILVMACGNIYNTGVAKSPDIYLGTDGLTASFIANTPPGQVLENSNFEMLLDVANQGAYDIDQAFFSISSNPEYLDITTTEGQRVLTLPGRSVENPRGEKSLLSLKAHANRVSKTSAVSTPVSLTFCYAYQTHATPIVCIDTDPANQKTQMKACSLDSSSSTSLGGGQGGPMTVTRVETSMLSHDDPDRLIPDVKVFIANQGNGDIIDTSQVEQYCGGSPSKNAFNIVNVKVKLQEDFLLCNKEALTLKTQDSSENYIECQYPQGINKKIPSYLAPLSVTIDYGYTFTVTKMISIQPKSR